MFPITDRRSPPNSDTKTYCWGKEYGDMWAHLRASDAKLFEWGNSECLGGIMPLPDLTETYICCATELAEKEVKIST